MDLPSSVTRLISALVPKYSEVPNKRADRNKQADWHFCLKIHKQTDQNKRVDWNFFENLVLILELTSREENFVY
jgi:hypothetical protein